MSHLLFVLLGMKEEKQRKLCRPWFPPPAAEEITSISSPQNPTNESALPSNLR